ncbi:Uncharacterised protein [Brucella intermedia]|nr:Uncharacterised protein [Brucella intermedia]
MCDGRLCRQPGVDQSSRRWSRGNAVGAGAAGIFGTTRDDDAELRWDDVQPLGDVLADAMQAAAAEQASRYDDAGREPRLTARGLGCGFPRGAIGFIFGMDSSNSRFKVLQCEIELLRIGLLGFAAEGCLLESCDQLLQSLDPVILVNFTRLRRDQHRLQCSNVVWKIVGV